MLKRPLAYLSRSGGAATEAEVDRGRYREDPSRRDAIDCREFRVERHAAIDK